MGFIFTVRNNFKQIFLFLREHCVAFCCAVFVGLFMIAPQVAFFLRAGDSYRGITIQKADAELMYLARIREVLDTGKLTNPLIFEGKSLPNVPYSVAEAILAAPSYVFGVSVVQMNLVYKFLFPAALFVAIYFFSLELFNKKTWALATPFVILIGYALTEVGAMKSILQGGMVFDQFLQYTRPVNPQLSSLIFFLELFVLFRSQKTGKQGYYIAAAILLGLSFYIYLYLFTFLCALFGFLILLNLSKKDLTAAKLLAMSLFAGLVMGSFALIQYYKIVSHSYYDELKVLTGVGETRKPVFGLFQGLVTIFAVGFFAIKKSLRVDVRGIFVIALLLTTVVVVNQQVITGVTVQLGHYHWYYNVPIFIVSVLWFLSELVSEKKEWSVRYLLLLLIGASIYVGAFIQISSYKQWESRIVKQQRYITTLEWLQKNTEPESVVLANDDLSELIPVYTVNNVFWQTMAFPFLMSSERRLLTRENFLAFDDKQKIEMKNARLDYVVWDTTENPSWNVDAWPLLHQVVAADGFKIYKRTY